MISEKVLFWGVIAVLSIFGDGQEPPGLGDCNSVLAPSRRVQSFVLALISQMKPCKRNKI